MCYHSISEHFPGQWSVVIEATTGKVFYQHAHSSAKLYARPYDPSADLMVFKSLVAEDTVVSVAQKLPQTALEPFTATRESLAAQPFGETSSRIPRMRQIVAFCPVPAGSTAISSMLVPCAMPTAVPDRVMANLSINLNQLATQQIAPELPVSVSCTTPLTLNCEVHDSEPSRFANQGSSGVPSEVPAATPTYTPPVSTTHEVINPVIAAFLSPLFEDPLLIAIEEAAFQPGGHK